jgi:acetolactate synthase-1/2/3 large subunit
MTYNAPLYRPVLIYGAGIHLSGCEKEAVEFARMTGIPVAPTWAALDIFPYDDPLLIGSFGTHGTRAGNFAVQNATTIISVGSRLDSKATGTPIESFAREAQITMVDIDQREIDKFGPRVKGLCCDAKEFFLNATIDARTFKSWVERIHKWKKEYPISEEGPYGIIKAISEQAQEGEIICTDTGCAVAWVSQAWRFKRGQRFIHAFNQTPMGYGLSAAIGAHYATGKRVVLVTGDGSLMMSIGELATIKDLPIKIFLLDNKGHAMCRQTQREWLNGAYPSTSIEGGLKFPDFFKVGWANEVSTYHVEDSRGLKAGISWALNAKGPGMAVFDVDPEADVVPKVKYGYANEDGFPLLPWEELKSQMIVEPYARP